MPESGSSRPDLGNFGRNPVIFAGIRPIQILTRLFGLRIPAFILDSGNSSQNPVNVAEILSISDEISSSVIFILFYINIYMF
jgi:exopolysaccharide biosynthesis protein